MFPYLCQFQFQLLILTYPMLKVFALVRLQFLLVRFISEETSLAHLTSVIFLSLLPTLTVLPDSQNKLTETFLPEIKYFFISHQKQFFQKSRDFISVNIYK